jgi:hypothetical protein
MPLEQKPSLTTRSVLDPKSGSRPLMCHLDLKSGESGVATCPNHYDWGLELLKHVLDP